MTHKPWSHFVETVSGAMERRGHVAGTVGFQDLYIDINGGVSVTEGKKEIIGQYDACLARPLFKPMLMNFLFSLEVLRCLEKKGLPIVNKPETYLTGANKLTQYAILSSEGIPVPRTVSSLEARSLVSSIPGASRLIAKRICGSRGRGIVEVKDSFPLSAAKDSVMLVQDFVRGENYDVRAFVVGYRPIAWMKRVSSEVTTNISRGGLPERFSPDEKTKLIASKAALATRTAIAGIDIAFDENRNPFVLEVNSQPDFIGLEMVSEEDIGSSIVDLMERIASGEQ